MLNLKSALGGKTAYAITQMIAAEIDPDKTEWDRIYRRWTRWYSGQGLETVHKLDDELRTIGLRLTIEIDPESPYWEK